MKSKLRILGYLVFILGLWGCSDIRFVENYDPVLDQGLSNFQADIAAFLAKMAANADKPEGKYPNAEVQAFYARTGAQLQSFVDRAEVLDEDGVCLPSNFAGRGIKKVVTESADFLDSVEIPHKDIGDIADVIRGFEEGDGEFSTGNCTVIVLKVVQANHQILRQIHKTNDSLPTVVVGIVGPILDQSTRIAIKNEVLKKNRNNQN